MNITDYMLKVFALLRAFFYLWITVESVFLGYLYWNAYKKYKTTPIIKAIQFLLFSIGLNFFYMVMVAVAGLLDKESLIYDLLIVFIPVCAVPLLMSIREFREKSTDSITDGENKLQKLEKHYKLQK